MPKKPSDGGMDIGQLRRSAYGRVFAAALALAFMCFLPAGTFDYREAWVYLGALLIPMLATTSYLLRRDPELLERRLRNKEPQAAQQLIVTLSGVMFLGVLLLPGLDHRYGWSSVPMPLAIAADALVLLGYGLFVLVIRENRYAARTVEVEKNQQVITTGPYALIRHPMYLAVSMIYVATPLALGSYWALIPAVMLPVLLGARILGEERFLHEHLAGYTAYTQKTRYRLIPGIW
jgi:protein-S-isoprenylcysteine O-methyltransferase Ste14